MDATGDICVAPLAMKVLQKGGEKQNRKRGPGKKTHHQGKWLKNGGYFIKLKKKDH